MGRTCIINDIKLCFDEKALNSKNKIICTFSFTKILNLSIAKMIILLLSEWFKDMIGKSIVNEPDMIDPAPQPYKSSRNIDAIRLKV